MSETIGRRETRGTKMTTKTTKSLWERTCEGLDADGTLVSVRYAVESSADEGEYDLVRYDDGDESDCEATDAYDAVVALGEALADERQAELDEATEAYHADREEERQDALTDQANEVVEALLADGKAEAILAALQAAGLI